MYNILNFYIIFFLKFIVQKINSKIVVLTEREKVDVDKL
jgi:hypothetical protein